MLSQFTGAARELTEALIVNPYDLDEASAALATALKLSPEEQRDRMRSMRAFLAEFNVYRWAGRMLVDAARLRSRDRLTGRLTDHLAVSRSAMRDILSRAGREVLQQFAGRTCCWRSTTTGPWRRSSATRTRPPCARRRGGCWRRSPLAIPASWFRAARRSDARRWLHGIRLRQVVGNHGIEPWQATRPLMDEVERWAPLLVRRLAGLKGVCIENKTFSVAVHYRLSREKKRARRPSWRRLRPSAPCGSSEESRWSTSFPRDAPHKGMALERERERLRHDTAIYVGDDETDEDVFALDQPGRLLTVRVGSNRLSQASYFLRNQAAVDEFLETLLSFRDESELPLAAQS